MQKSPQFESAVRAVELSIQRSKDREENDSNIINLINAAQNIDELIYALSVYHICGNLEEDAFHKKIRQFRSIITTEQVNKLLTCFNKNSNCHNYLCVIKLRLEVEDK